MIDAKNPRWLTPFLLPLLLPANGAAQSAQAGAEAEVRAALQHYLDGHATGEGAHHDSVFHEKSYLYWIADGELRSRSSADYIAGAPGRPAADESERKRRIVWVDIEGDAAVARIELDYPGARITDYMSLLLVDGEWRIMNKIFTVDRSGDAAGGEAAGAPDPADARAAIESASRAFSAAYVAGDTAAIRQLYTEDAVLLPPGAEIRGRDGIARYFAPGPRRTNLTHAMRSDAIRVTGATAVDIGTWTNVWTIDGGPRQEASGQYLVVWRRDNDGRWRIEYDMWHRPAGN